MSDLESELIQRANVGQELGADAVWAAATKQSNQKVGVDRKFSTARVAVLACTAVVVVGGVASIWFANGRSESVVDAASGTSTATSAPESATPGTSTESTPEPGADEQSVETDGQPDQGDYQKTVDAELTAIYTSCVQELGADADLADVIVNPEGDPVQTKTSPAIPASAHGPCFARVGGSVVPGQSAWDDTIFLDCTDPGIRELETPCHEDFVALASTRSAAPESSSVDNKRTVSYQACVGKIDAGLSKFSVEVFRTPDGKVAGIQVDGEIPAAIHGYCYARVGGLVIGGTSSNEQPWVDDCSTTATKAVDEAQSVLNCAEEKQPTEPQQPR